MARACLAIVVALLLGPATARADGAAPGGELAADGGLPGGELAADPAGEPDSVFEPDGEADDYGDPFGPRVRFSMLGAGVTAPIWRVSPRTVSWASGALGAMPSDQMLGARVLLAPGIVADMDGFTLHAHLGPTIGVVGEQADRGALSQSIDTGLVGFEARVTALAPVSGADSLGVAVSLSATWAFTGVYTVNGSGVGGGGVVEERVSTPDMRVIEILVLPTWSRYGGMVGVGLDVQHHSVDAGIGSAGVWSDWFVGVAVSGGFSLDL